MHFKSTIPLPKPTSNLETVYHIGFNEDDGIDIMHSLDTTEVPTDCVVGRAKFKDNSLAFQFEYEDADFYNVFSWRTGEEKWLFQQSTERDVGTSRFATKEMGRSVGDRFCVVSQQNDLLDHAVGKLVPFILGLGDEKLTDIIDIAKQFD
jgi:hypothetical protein